ncbi:MULTISPECIES: hypothetical protein [unclassified Bradyrhizobium]|uniref:hypothetical protein n=1 Tax=unclassified Bradyrhizobium TaxID=2631580 RepID=UPI000403CD87|nr:MULTISPECIES: hypothetical protein [unclassified Bradyrhizobium]QIG95218.1 hypothetical protein G6P99_24310 [Bradyrhizobium sp. 6(2017)]
MRKLILIPAFILASLTTAHAGQSRGLVLAAADAPAQARPAAAASQADSQPAPSQAQSAEAPRQQASRPVNKSHARRRESDEAKARRIAARYGVTW